MVSHCFHQLYNLWTPVYKKVQLYVLAKLWLGELLTDKMFLYHIQFDHELGTIQNFQKVQPFFWGLIWCPGHSCKPWDLTHVQTLFSPVTSEKNDYMYLCTIIFWGGLGLKPWQSEASINEQKHSHSNLIYYFCLVIWLDFK